ncbi:sensor histidine kinase [Hephaestia mangrovi]|uniref:sensor histidine kinase n=1 Tax=Hephaestia mangrovi TaxID=2873268 RepID=UPI001CA70FE5|nr:HAMP domain-containing sensor histidine kinase [Hephaestia mangrovi]MBY8828031.1 HAMP domain-containing histidine kinase [Hephaestia mangrovi]
MIAWAKAIAKAHWPALSLRTILFGTLLFVAALPGVAALSLRVYENTIVQQTEAELIAQSAVLAAAYRVDWLAGRPDTDPRKIAPEPPTIDLRAMPILPPQPAATTGPPPIPRAAAVARALLPVANDAASITLAATRLLDARGTVLIGHADTGMSYATLPEVKTALAGRSATVLRRRAGEAPHPWLTLLSRAWGVRVHHARPVLLDGRVIGVVMLSRTPRGLFLGVWQDRGKILLGIAVIFAVLLVLAGLLSRGIARPIDALARASEGVALGAVAMPETPPTAAIEIARLYDNFRAMAERIERRSNYLRDVAAAVSHEFKTPLAGITGALELLDEHGAAMSDPERRRFLANATADAQRLSRLVQRLLDLARADMAVADRYAAADVAAVCNVVADAFRGDHFAPEVAVPAGVTARIAPEILATVLETLAENSVQADASALRFSATRESGNVLLTIADNGSGIAPTDRERVFEPFFTGRREAGGAGMGLAIVRSLIAAAGGTIVAQDAAAGAIFTITLPATT